MNYYIFNNDGICVAKTDFEPQVEAIEYGKDIDISLVVLREGKLIELPPPENMEEVEKEEQASDFQKQIMSMVISMGEDIENIQDTLSELTEKGDD